MNRFTAMIRFTFATLLLLAPLGPALPTVLAQQATAQGAATQQAGAFDNGRMWTFDVPPTAYFAEEYDFAPNADWFEKARMGALRLPNCTASFVSPMGLVMTNHHCGRGAVADVTREGETLLDDGFTAASMDEERPVEGLYVDQLIAIEDVTDNIQAAIDRATSEAGEGGLSDAERADIRREAIEAEQKRIESAFTGSMANNHLVQIISLYSGGRYSAYTFRRFTDLRLVMAPELNLGYFGGDTDNFTYPRYALDMTFFRVYEDGAPYEPEHYFAWSADGAEENEPVFVVGNPGSTLRLETVSQLEWRRDVQEKALLELLNSRIAILEDAYAAEPTDALLNMVFSLKNAQKLYGGRVRGLHDPDIMARRRATEADFLAAAPTDVVAELDRIQQEKRAFSEEYAAFLSFFPQSSLASPTMQRAAIAWQLLRERAAGGDVNALAVQLSAVPDKPEVVDRMFFAARLEDFVAHLGARGPLADSHPDVWTASVFLQSALRPSAFTPGQEFDTSTLTMDDPAIAAIAPYMEDRQAFTSAFAGLSAQESELNARHGRERFDVYDTTRPPDATFSLRLADGRVSSYTYNGTLAPAFTTFYGMYDRAASHSRSAHDTGEWTLPERWLSAPDAFDRSTPMNLVSTNDIVGGNSGSPLLNRDLEVVGLIFDGNVESLPSAFIFRTNAARAVSVDSRGMLEALRHVYGMEYLADELSPRRSPVSR
ncbi:MAG: peptidase S46 [Bacteroidetes bacterium CG12_big_fil_rev_8_21_14_0_65_60_17]|nr:MAG: peptidase S46 [Bacteroidetes bacterium CG12_big_fil_rev_8_21_14_0_65_60_17]